MRLNFSWIIQDAVAGMAMPRPEDLPFLQGKGIGAVVSLTEEQPEGMEAFASLHLPVPDFEPPPLEDLRRATDFIRESLDSGRKVAVHCGAGIGRTGTVLAAFLVTEGCGPDEAIQLIRALRPGSIETGEQEAIVRRFAEAEQGGGG
ncbi:MAG: phosphatase domain-containing protein [Planctomycetaceae bacterium]